MDFATLVFWIIAVILVGAALAVVAFRNIVHSALALVIVFAMAAGIYLLLNAEFIAIVQILIYVGAITILILFAIMLTRVTGTQGTNPVSRQWWLGAIVSILVGVGIIYAEMNSAHAVSDAGASVALPVSNVVRIGQLLYSPVGYSYVLPCQVATLVLLVAIIGAIVNGRED